MREIEFRAKAKNKNAWIYGDLIHDENGYSILSKKEGCLKIKPNTIGQYTELKDKNGRKIFEGDIVKYTRKHMYCPTANFHNKDLVSLHKIYWNEEHYQFWEEQYPLDDREFRCIGGGPIGFDDERADENIIEVVSNIYDNPELLKGE